MMAFALKLTELIFRQGDVIHDILNTYLFAVHFNTCPVSRASYSQDTDSTGCHHNHTGSVAGIQECSLPVPLRC